MKNMVVVVQDKRITMKEKILAVVTLVVVGIIRILEIIVDNSNQMKRGSFSGGSLNRTYGSGYGYGGRSGGLW